MLSNNLYTNERLRNPSIDPVTTISKADQLKTVKLSEDTCEARILEGGGHSTELMSIILGQECHTIKVLQAIAKQKARTRPAPRLDFPFR